MEHLFPFKSLNLDEYRVKQEGHSTLLTVLNINQVLILQVVYPYISIVSKLLASLLFEHFTSHIKNNCRIRNVYQSHMCFQEKWRCKTNLNCLRSFFHLQVVMENPLPAKFIQCAVLNCSLLLTGCCSKNMAIYFNREFFQATELSSLEIYFLLHN